MIEPCLNFTETRPSGPGQQTAESLPTTADDQQSITKESSPMAISDPQSFLKSNPVPPVSNLEARILELRAEGLSYSKVAKRLNDEGVQTVFGQPWKIATVQYYTRKSLGSTKPRRKSGRSIGRPKLVTAEMPKFVAPKMSKLTGIALGILTDPDLSDRQKVCMLKAYSGALT